MPLMATVERAGRNESGRRVNLIGRICFVDDGWVLEVITALQAIWWKRCVLSGTIESSICKMVNHMDLQSLNIAD